LSTIRQPNHPRDNDKAPSVLIPGFFRDFRFPSTGFSTKNEDKALNLNDIFGFLFDSHLAVHSSEARAGTGG
jgi:hypothetical protein